VCEGPSGQRSDRRVLRQAGDSSSRETKGANSWTKKPTGSMCWSIRLSVCLGTASTKTAESPFHAGSAGLLAVFGGLVVLCRHYVWSRVAGTVCGQTNCGGAVAVADTKAVVLNIIMGDQSGQVRLRLVCEVKDYR
jgi:hypothetical protein